MGYVLNPKDVQITVIKTETKLRTKANPHIRKAGNIYLKNDNAATRNFKCFDDLGKS